MLTLEKQFWGLRSNLRTQPSDSINRLNCETWLSDFDPLDWNFLRVQSWSLLWSMIIYFKSLPSNWVIQSLRSRLQFWRILSHGMFDCQNLNISMRLYWELYLIFWSCSDLEISNLEFSLETMRLALIYWCDKKLLFKELPA